MLGQLFGVRSFVAEDSKHEAEGTIVLN